MHDEAVSRGSGGRTFTVGAVLVTTAVASGVFTAPVALAYPPDTCSDTSRTNIPYGDPDYGSWLDRDDDGIACEAESAGYYPSYGPREYTTFVTWLYVDCIQVRFPNGTQFVEQTMCDSDPAFSRGQVSHGNWIDHTAYSGQLIGADPLVDASVPVSCTVEDSETDVELIDQFAGSGDGFDVNCIIPAP